MSPVGRPPAEPIVWNVAARVVQSEGAKWNKKSYLLMHAMGANAGGRVIAAAVMLSVLAGMGIIRGNGAVFIPASPFYAA